MEPSFSFLREMIVSVIDCYAYVVCLVRNMKSLLGMKLNNPEKSRGT